MKYSLVIHLGYPKTATSFLQNHYFSKLDVKFYGMNHRKFDSGYEEFKLFLQSFENIDQIKAEDLSDELQKLKLDKKKINIISDESIMCNIVHNNTNTYLILKNLLSFFKFFEDQVELKIFFTFRKHDEIILSYFREFYLSFFHKEFKNYEEFVLQIGSNQYVDQILRIFNFSKFYNYLNQFIHKDNILVLNYSNFNKNPKKFILKLKEFIGIDEYFFPDFNTKENEFIKRNVKNEILIFLKRNLNIKIFYKFLFKFKNLLTFVFNIINLNKKKMVAKDFKNFSQTTKKINYHFKDDIEEIKKILNYYDEV